MLGTAIGVPMFIGGVLAGVPALAVVAIAALGVGSAVLAARVRLGQVAMTLSLPMVGVGLSYPGLGKAAGLAGLMVLGSIFGCLVSMLWPEHAVAPAGAAGPRPTLGYGIRLGAAGATAATIGFLLDLFLMLLYSRPQDAASRFDERLLETALGVGIAYVFGLALPALAQRRPRGGDQPN